MKMKAVAGIAIVAAISAMILGPMLGAYAQPAYTQVKTSNVSTNPAGTTTTFQITTNGTIPHTADPYIKSVLVFGYAWLLNDSGTINVVVAAIHPGIKDSVQNPNNWHVHTATLVSSSDCSGLGLGLQVTNLKAPEGGVPISGSSISVILASSKVPAGTPVGATAFQLVQNATSGALCVAPP